MENTTHEAMIDVAKSKDDTTAASMLILLWNLLQDPNIIRPPQEIPNEKNICSAAFLHTPNSKSFHQSGTNKNLRPTEAPGRVTPRINRANRMK